MNIIDQKSNIVEFDNLTKVLDLCTESMLLSSTSECIKKLIKSTIQTINNRRIDIIFDSIAATNINNKSSTIKLATKIKLRCSVCKSMDNFDIINNTVYICRLCGNQKDVPNMSPMYKDTQKINTLRYMYKRRVHFKDCINQYQGKQNVTIPEYVITHIKDNMNRHDLTTSTITKEHILMFMKDAKMSKYYEDINLIYKIISSKSVDDIAYLEDIIISDFNVLTDLYDKKFKQTDRISRKSFINTHYVLYQLLRRHNHPCRRDDFNILKTVDRKLLHEDIICELFNDLGWNFTSLF